MRTLAHICTGTALALGSSESAASAQPRLHRDLQPHSRQGPSAWFARRSLRSLRECRVAAAVLSATSTRACAPISRHFGDRLSSWLSRLRARLVRQFQGRCRTCARGRSGIRCLEPLGRAFVVEHSEDATCVRQMHGPVSKYSNLWPHSAGIQLKLELCPPLALRLATSQERACFYMASYCPASGI